MSFKEKDLSKQSIYILRLETCTPCLNESLDVLNSLNNLNSRNILLCIVYSEPSSWELNKEKIPSSIDLLVDKNSVIDKYKTGITRPTLFRFNNFGNLEEHYEYYQGQVNTLKIALEKN